MPLDDTGHGEAGLERRRGSALDAEWAAADLSLLISRAETFGLVVTESIARGVPVVVRAGTGAVEALAAGTPAGADDAAALPETAVALGTDPAPLTQVLRRWLSDPGLRARWQATAVAARDRLPGWDTTALTVLDALDPQHPAADDSPAAQAGGE